MKTDKNVSRRQFLLVGALTGGGLMLSESGCAPNVKQTHSGGPSVATGPVQNKQPFASGTRSAPYEQTLQILVENQLRKAYPVVRDVPNDKLIAVYNIKGTVDKPPLPNFSASLGGLSMQEILVNLFPSIQFTVLVDSSGANLSASYRLHPRVSNSTDPLITTQIKDRTLIEIGTMLNDFTFTVMRNGVNIGDYQILGRPFPDVTQASDPDLYKPHGKLNLHVIGDLLESMQFTFQKVSSLSSHRGRSLPSATSARTIMVAANKYRRE